MSKDSNFIKLASLHYASRKGGTIIHRDATNSTFERQIAEGPGATQIFENMHGVEIRDSYAGPDATKHLYSLLIRDISASGHYKSEELISMLSKIVDASNPEGQKTTYRKLLEFLALHNDAFGPIGTSVIAFATSVIAKITV
ncbi:hypothetical protein GFB19_03025 [Escherichia coli]|uniref:hypothetical protein n=1 Tax=Escherichia coli TaxID=562 RepID=UPI0017CB9840|nr:hypothetical protein [Escherichia coli]EFE6859280.1 hypothetical protein [Escherichia coli]EGB2408948.1 hypothetical protein [Escherichia coli]EKO1175644.1 hypothetical protein [Escherichia coli]MCB4483557.1 hypothetical protein [Escherichia coli]CAK0703099.1 hypothetical protein FGAF467_15180 [Escherichia coli]